MLPFITPKACRHLPQQGASKLVQNEAMARSTDIGVRITHSRHDPAQIPRSHSSPSEQTCRPLSAVGDDDLEHTNPVAKSLSRLLPKQAISPCREKGWDAIRKMTDLKISPVIREDVPDMGLMPPRWKGSDSLSHAWLRVLRFGKMFVSLDRANRQRSEIRDQFALSPFAIPSELRGGRAAQRRPGPSGNILGGVGNAETDPRLPAD